MKIMFVTIFFAPFNTIGAVRTTRTAEKLLKFGCDVQVISATDLPFQDDLDTTFPKTRINATKWWNIGLFETIMWQAQEDNFYRGYDIRC